MTKIIFFLATTIFTLVFSANAQVYLGAHLNDIKKEHPNGKLEPNQQIGYVYQATVKSQNDHLVFMLDQQLYCYITIVSPLTSGSVQAWVELLNKQWVIVDDYHWKFYRKDGNIVLCEMRTIEDVEYPCFRYSIAKRP